jgi:hypothetical protein
MKALVGLYVGIGVVLLGVAFLLAGACPNRNTDIVSNAVFVMTWPVGLYAEVYRGQLSAEEWLHEQACRSGGGLGIKKAAF